MLNTLNILKIIFSEVLLSPIDEIDITKPYVNMGMDSILAIQVARLIQIKLEVPILPADLYNFLSIKDLCNHINEKKNNLLEDKRTATPKKEEIALKNSPSFAGHKNDNEKIVIVGIAGRFPSADNVQEYWDNLINQKNTITESDRWLSKTGRKYTGGFLKSIEDFDADFFNISPREALYMDPQQRILMEIAWQAFEDAGLSVDKLAFAKCGVFCASLPGDYKYRFQNRKDAYNTFSFLGNAVSVMAGRISHFFNLKGPTITIDTACSSALVGINLAVNHLKQNLCDVALVGTSSIFSTPELFELAESSHLLSKSGQCYTFDERADGFVPAESVACVVLRRLSDAMRDQQQIYAVIEACQVNHDGYTNGLMSPNSNSQKDLILSLYKEASIHPQEIGYVEAHGTGTALGDPLETRALTEVFDILDQNYLSYIGSSKTNIGHALVASGMAGLFKILFAFKNNKIPGHLHFQHLNPQINLGKFQINTTAIEWPENKHLAAMSAFGFSGTNAHLVLRKMSIYKPDSLLPKPYLFIFSSKNPESLRRLLKMYIPFLESIENSHLGNISFSLNCKITHFSHRFITVSTTKNELLSNIKDFLNNPESSIKVSTPILLQSIPELISELNKASQDNDSIREEMLQLLADKLLTSETFELNALYNQKYQKITLPPYPFCSKRYWIEDDISNHNLLEKNLLPLKGELKNIQDKEPIIKKIREKLSELLGYDPDHLPINKSFAEYGIDSLIALQLLEIFTPIYGKLGPNIIFEQNTIENLANYLLKLKPNKSLGNTEKEEIAIYLKCLESTDYQRILQKTNQSEIEWIVYGRSGYPLLFLPPLNMLAHAWIQQIRFFLGKSFQLFIPHYPGHGASPFIQQTLEKSAKIIFEGFNTIAPPYKTVNIIGWSLGGCLSLILSNLFPHKINKMILVNTAAHFEDDLFSESIKLRSELTEKSDYLNILFNNTKSNIIDYLSAGCSLDVLKHYYTALQSFNFSHKLDSIAVKSKIIYGLQDPVIREHEVHTLTKIKNSNIHAFENHGHFIPLTSPYRFNKSVEQFLNL